MNKKEMMNYIKQTSFIPSKKMGQNFLFSSEYQNKIVDSLSECKNIVEVGPGLGALTDILLSKKDKNIKLIELDKRIVEYIKKKHNNVEIINNNFLKVELDNLFNGENYSLISNLPYSISSNAIVNVIKCTKIDEAVILIQKEVADRILADIDDEKYNGFSIFVKTLADVKKLFDIPSTVFYPEPQVTSTLIKIVNKKNLNLDKNKYEKFIRMCFLQKRKTIINNLKNYFKKDDVINILDSLNIPTDIRPEKITIDEYKIIFERLYERNN